MTTSFLRLAVCTVVSSMVGIGLEPSNAFQLRVSESGRHLATSAGEPFFYLGDTAWELFHRLNREEADLYLDNRAKKASPSSRRLPWPNSTGSTRRTPTGTVH